MTSLAVLRRRGYRSAVYRGILAAPGSFGFSVNYYYFIRPYTCRIRRLRELVVGLVVGWESFSGSGHTLWTCGLRVTENDSQQRELSVRRLARQE